jgi:putative phage-type endonuclease
MAIELVTQLKASLEAHDRSQYIGGSDMAAIIGCSPWKTPYRLWLEKVGQYIEPIDAEREKLFRRGKLLEPVVLEMARQEYGLEITANNKRYYDSELPFLSCEIDFEWQDVDGIQNADVKTVHPRVAYQWGEQGTDDIPVYYTVQFLFGQMITERERTLCTALVGADDLRVYRTERDEDAITYLRGKAIDFWDMVQTRTPPPVTSIEDCNLAWPQDSGKAIQATAEIEEMIARHKMIKKSLAGDEAKCNLLELDIFKFMADSTEIVDGAGRKLATRKLQQRAAYTVQPTSFRVFRAA